MGYEITVHYHPAVEGGYDLTKTLTRTKRIGRATDPPNDSLLARELLREYSRRDVLVTDIRVEEFVKRPVKVKPCKNGIVMIRGVKFSLEGHGVVAVEEVVPPTGDESTPLEDHETVGGPGFTNKPAAVKTQQPPRPNPTHQSQPKVADSPTRPALRREIFDPPLRVEKIWRAQGLQPGVTMEILEETKLGDKIYYTVRLPSGAERKGVPSDLFVSEGLGLSWETETPQATESEPQLSFEGNVRTEMPRLRG